MTETFHAGPGLGRLSDVTIIHGDCIDAIAELAADSVDAIVTDPPYGLGFMGKAWDALPPGLEWAKQCLRVLKPGGHLLAFGGTRTWHRLAVAVEDAGFELRDSIAWLYSQGFPKSLDVSKAIDKAAGATREKVPATGGLHANANLNDDGWSKIGSTNPMMDSTTPATPEAAQWSGWGTALKPAFEPIVVARKPLVGTVAANVLEHGTGALNVDGCRIEGKWTTWTRKDGTINPSAGFADEYVGGDTRPTNVRNPEHPAGRWPANVVLDADQAAALDEQSGTLTTGGGRRNGAKKVGIYGAYAAGEAERTFDANSGGASRFFYCAKAPKKERPVVIDADGKAHSHATVKPLTLMRWLVRLVTPPGGVVLDPFAGSGTTVEAALLEDFRVIGIERGGPEGTPESHYLAMIQQRIVRSLNV